MSGIKSIPKPHSANLNEIGDFIELECLRRADKNVSALDITRIIEREAEQMSQDTVLQYVRDSIKDLESRISNIGTMGAAYPYQVDPTGDLIAYRTDIGDADRMIYLFLVLCTRLNMKSDRKHATHDAAIFFEQLCREVSLRLWGGKNDNRVNAIVFGTGRLVDGSHDHDPIDVSTFEAAVNNLCVNLCEGVGFDAKSDGPITAKDGKLDVVVWRRFSDSRHGQLIGFGQCKTGTSWESDLMKLRPDDFFSKWVRQHPTVLPVRLYFITDRVIDRWYDRSRDGGVLLDRCRIMEYCAELPSQLVKQITDWVAAAAVKHGLKIA